MKTKVKGIVKSRHGSAFFLSPQRLKALRTDPVIKGISRIAPEGVYLVGGVLRNLFLKKDFGCDYDLCVSRDSRQFANDISDWFRGSFFLLDEDTQTFRVVMKKTSCTVDVSVMKGSDIVEDLRERDFTVNAMAVALNEIFASFQPVVIDPFGGIRDIKKKTLKVATGTSFDRDPLRVIRAVRLANECGLRIEGRTLKLIKAKAPLLEYSAVERIRDEVIAIFSNDSTAEALKKFIGCGAWEVIFGELKDWNSSPPPSYDILGHSLLTLKEAEKTLKCQLVKSHPAVRRHFEGEVSKVKRSCVFKLASFFHDIGKPSTMKVEDGLLSFMGHEVAGEALIKKVLRRLKFPRNVVKLTSTLVRNHHRLFALVRLDEPSRRARVHFFNALRGPAGIDLLLMGLADARATRGREDPVVRSSVKDMLGFYFRSYIKKKPKRIMDGVEIMKTFRVKEGPMVGEIMKIISNGIEEGVIKDKKGAIGYVKERIKMG